MTAPVRKLTADDVCAFCWDQVTEHMRAALCALVGLPQTLALLDWYEIGKEYRALLRLAISDLIEHNASRQRAEWAQAGRVAA